MDEKELEKIETKIRQFKKISHDITCRIDRVQKEIRLLNALEGRLFELYFDMFVILETKEDETPF